MFGQPDVRRSAPTLIDTSSGPRVTAHPARKSRRPFPTPSPACAASVAHEPPDDFSQRPVRIDDASNVQPSPVTAGKCLELVVDTESHGPCVEGPTPVVPH